MWQLHNLTVSEGERIAERIFLLRKDGENCGCRDFRHPFLSSAVAQSTSETLIRVYFEALHLLRHFSFPSGHPVSLLECLCSILWSCFVLVCGRGQVHARHGVLSEIHGFPEWTPRMCCFSSSQSSKTWLTGLHDYLNVKLTFPLP